MYRTVISGMLLLILFVSSAQAAQNRTWTDTQGNQILAKFISIEGDQVTLLKDFKKFVLPLSKFSAEDQQYVKEQQNAKSSPAPATNSPENTTATASQMRSWTDSKGNKLTAKFVRVHENNVVLRANTGKINSVPFTEFSKVDQDFVVNLLREQGDEQLAEQFAQRALASAKPVSSPSSSSSRPSTPSSRPNTPSRSSPIRSPVRPPSGIPSAASIVNDALKRQQEMLEKDRQRREEFNRKLVEDTKRRQKEYDESRRKAAEEQQRKLAEYRKKEAQRIADEQRRREQAAEARRRDQEALASNSSSSWDSLVPSSASSPTPSRSTSSNRSFPNRPSSMSEEVGVCSNCNKTVPAHIGAGDRCPHCRIFFSYEEDATGNRDYAPGGGGGAVGGIVFAVIFVVSLLGGIIKKALS